MPTSSTLRDQAGAVRRGATALSARARAERTGDLSLNQVAVLGRVATHGPITPGEIAAQLRMMPQSLTRTFAMLEGAGYVRRMPDPGDGRQSLLQATADGIAVLKAEMAPRDRWVAAAMAAVLSDAERRTVVEAAGLMARMVDWGGGVAQLEP